MKLKIIAFYLLLSFSFSTRYSLAQNSSDSSRIPSAPSAEENQSLTHELNIHLSESKNYFIKIKVGEELAIKVNNPNDLYHSGENQPYNDKNDPGFNDLSHRLCTSLYSDSWNPWNKTLSLQKEYDLDQETGDPLVYYFKAVHRGTTFIYFHTTYLDRPCIYLEQTIPHSISIGPKISVEVSQ